MLATAMAAVSGTVIVLALCLQKSLPTTTAAQFSVNHPRSCISSDEKRIEKKKKKKKRVHFAEDVVDPTRNSEEFRRRLDLNSKPPAAAATPRSNKVRMREMPANRMALYNGILRNRVVHRPAYVCSY